MPYTVADVLRESAAASPRATAVLDGESATSYQELYETARHHAGYLTRAGVRSGARIALLAPRSAAALAAFFGIHLAGAVSVVLHEQLKPRQLAAILASAETDLVLTTARLRGQLTEAGISAELIAELDQAAAAPCHQPQRIGQDLAALAYTSGSTGQPKGVMLSHANLLAGARIVTDYLSITNADRILALLPWAFDYGLNQALTSIATGATLVIQRSAHPGGICRTLTEARVTGMAAVPAIFAQLTAPGSPLLSEAFPHLRYVTNSGGALPPTATAALRAAQPHTQIFAMYGLTEAFRSTYLDPHLIDAKPTSIGRAIPDTEILLVAEDGEPVPDGAIGQIVHRGPTVALGYWKDPQSTASVFRPLPGPPCAPPETVVYTGDYALRDPDGDLHYRGRRDQMFKSRGFRVTPEEIEAELLASNLLAAAVVIPEAVAGHQVEIAAIVQPGYPHGFEIAELEHYAQTAMPPHMRPARWHVAAALPLNANGKVDRQALRERLRSAPAAAETR